MSKLVPRTQTYCDIYHYSHGQSKLCIEEAQMMANKLSFSTEQSHEVVCSRKNTLMRHVLNNELHNWKLNHFFCRQSKDVEEHDLERNIWCIKVQIIVETSHFLLLVTWFLYCGCTKACNRQPVIIMYIWLLKKILCHWIMHMSEYFHMNTLLIL